MLLAGTLRAQAPNSPQAHPIKIRIVAGEPQAPRQAAPDVSHIPAPTRVTIKPLWQPEPMSTATTVSTVSVVPLGPAPVRLVSARRNRNYAFSAQSVAEIQPPARPDETRPDETLPDPPTLPETSDDVAQDEEPEVIPDAVTLPPQSGPAFYGAYPISPTCPVCGVYCDNGACCDHHRPKWHDATLIPWDVFAQGEYIGPERLVHVPQYILRVDDKIDFVYRITAVPSRDAYKFNVGDSLRIESLTEDALGRTVIIQPDGNITVHLLGQFRAAGRTIEAIRGDLQEQYKKFVKDPEITVTPLVMNTTLTELRNTVDSRYGIGGQTLTTTVTPEGTVQLPGLGSVPVHGLSLNQLYLEVNSRYARLIHGVEVTPVLVARAPRFVYVLGSVEAPGRYEMTGPTTVMQALAMAGSYELGSGLKHVVIFRRDENWQLMATHVDMNHLRWGSKPCPAGELWVRDSDVIMVPQRPLENANQIIDHVFTRGLYGVLPVNFQVNFAKLSTI
jgi:polysaccharide export outer membrane protein